MKTVKYVVLTLIVLTAAVFCFEYFAGKLYYVGPEVEMCAELAAMQEDTEVLFFSGYANEYFSWTPPKNIEVIGQAIFKDKRIVEYNCKYRDGDMDIKATVKYKGMLPD